MPLLDSSILKAVALKTDLFSAADLANVVKEVNFIISLIYEISFINGHFLFLRQVFVV